MTALALSLATTDTADGPVFENYYVGYEAAFTLPDETEDREGFAACLALNHGAGHDRLAARFGPCLELCVVASDCATGEMIGGANFIAIAPAPGIADAPVTANLNYFYICPAARGRGAMRPFVSELRTLIGSLFPGVCEREVAIFVEQNDPFRMSREDYERDSRHSGMDQFDRLRIWARLGARVIDFPYVQPPLSDDQQADGSLIYSVLGLKGDLISPFVLRHHLAAFFGISVLKGASLESVPAAVAQLDGLDRLAEAGDQIDLLDPTTFLASVGEPGALLSFPGRPQDMRSALARSIAE